MPEPTVIHFRGKPVSTSVDSSGGGPQDPSMEARVAVLEKIASNTEAMLTELRTDVRAIRTKQEDDYRALSDKITNEILRLYLAGGAAALALMGLMAKGFKWL